MTPEDWRVADFAVASSKLSKWMPDILEIGLSADDAVALEQCAAGNATDSAFSEALLTDLQDVVDAIGGPVFLRMSYCSFKPDGGVVLPVGRVEDALRLFRLQNRRLSSLLSLARIEEKPIALYAMAWRTIPPWSEFRAFVKDRNLVGLTQYHHRQPYREIYENPEIVKQTLTSTVQQLISALPTQNVIIDFEIQKDNRIIVIELNPFVTNTSPCLYTWANMGDFDSALRFLGPDKITYRI